MPITKATGYKASDGVVYATVEEARRAELRHTLWPSGQDNGLYNGVREMTVEAFEQAIVNMILVEQEAILAILTTGPRSRPSTRKRAGTTNPRRATKQQAAAGFKAMREAANDAPVPDEPIGAAGRLAT